MTDKLTEAARASCRALWEGPPPCEGVCQTCMDSTLAVLRAIREPSEAMLEAMRASNEYRRVASQSYAAWLAAIDALMAEGETGEMA